MILSMPTLFVISCMFTIFAFSPMAVFPEAGVGWCPVMAVMRLSSMMTHMFALLYDMFSSADIPAWKKVESPSTVNILSFTPACIIPAAWEMPPPMQRHVCMVFNGGKTPRE